MKESGAVFPGKLRFLKDPAPYKVIYGGRDGCKSWGAAQQLIINGSERKIRWLCARETQKSMADSVHKLLGDTIERLGLGYFYTITQTAIRGANGTEFLFAGIKDAKNIKSYESCDGVWVEEAQAVSKRSWEIILPTIRKEGSEVWVTFNPEFDTDDTYQRWVVNPPPGAKVVKIGWEDNPWLSEVSRARIEHMQATDPVGFDYVYGGHPRSSVEGAIYEQEIRAAIAKGQFTRIPYDPTRPVDTFWDLGFQDAVTIWFAQAMAFEYRIIDYYQDNMKAIDHYMQVLQQRNYTYGTCVLPWDGGAKSLGTGRSIEELIRAKGFKVRVMPQFRVADGINAVRTIFPQCYFDQGRCADGISALRRYKWGPPSPDGKLKREPFHDDASHAADALRAMAVYIKFPPKPAPPRKQSYEPGTVWG